MAAQGSGHATQWHYNDHSFTEELDRGAPVPFSCTFFPGPVIHIPSSQALESQAIGQLRKFDT